MPHDSSSQPLLDAAVDHAPVGMAVLDAELRYLHVNAALAELNGIAVDAHIGRRLDEIVPRDVADRVAPVIRRVLDTGQPCHGVEFGRGAPDDSRRLEASYFPIAGDGTVTAIGAVILDVTDRDQALARARYLAEASAALGSSLDLDATLHTVAGLAVPEVADWAFVELCQPDGSIKRVAWAHADPSLGGIVREYDERYPLNPRDPEGSAKVV